MKDRIILYNPSIGTMNAGDYIIYDSIKTQILNLLPDSNYYELPTQMPVSRRVLKWYSDIDIRFLCGTNLLKNHMIYEWKHHIPCIKGVRQWDINLINANLYGPVVLFGCGWQKYQGKNDILSEKLWNTLLDSKYIHSVRDTYTKEKLSEMGIKNVVNTGCPTLWSLTREFCERIPDTKAERVVTTLTDYRRDEKKDQLMIDTLCNNYEKVYIWLQGYNDGDYIGSLRLQEKVSIVKGSLVTYDKLLDEKDIEYVGTRLHGGIRALQHGRRTLFISIDNRTTEMGKTLNLNTIDRKDVLYLEEYINCNHKCKLKLPEKEIQLFKRQFGGIQ